MATAAKRDSRWQLGPLPLGVLSRRHLASVWTDVRSLMTLLLFQANSSNEYHANATAKVSGRMQGNVGSLRGKVLIARWEKARRRGVRKNRIERILVRGQRREREMQRVGVVQDGLPRRASFY